MWTLDKAVDFIRMHQPAVMASGWCLMLGGSVLNKGQGEDLDLMVYPRTHASELGGFFELFPEGDMSHCSVAVIYEIPHENGPVEFILQDHVPAAIRYLGMG